MENEHWLYAKVRNGKTPSGRQKYKDVLTAKPKETIKNE